MSDITPAYRPFESRSNPSAPEAAFTTAYPLRSSAARKNATTDGSSSITRIGPPVHNADCTLTGSPLSRPPRPAKLPSPPELAPQTYSPHLPHYSSTESPRHARERFRNKCSAPALFLCPPAWWCKTDRRFVADRRCPSRCR